MKSSGLRDFGRSVADEDGPTFRVEWDDLGDQISWGDGAMRMFQFRQLGQQALSLAIAGCNSLMYHWKPVIRLGKIKDRMSNASKCIRLSPSQKVAWEKRTWSYQDGHALTLLMV